MFRRSHFITVIGLVWIQVNGSLTQSQNLLSPASELPANVPDERIQTTEQRMNELWGNAEQRYENLQLSDALALYHRGLSVYEESITQIMESSNDNSAAQRQIELAEAWLGQLRQRFLSRIEWIQRRGLNPLSSYVREVTGEADGEPLLGEQIHWVTAHRERVNHATSQVLMMTQDGYVVVQQRPDRKTDISAAGHTRGNEDYREAAKRLIQSETGLSEPREEALKLLTGVKGERKIGSLDFDELPYYDGDGIFHSVTGEPHNVEHSRFFLYVLTPEEAAEIRRKAPKLSETRLIGFEPLHTVERLGVEIPGLVEQIQPEGMDETTLKEHLRKYASATLQFFRHPD